MEVLAQPIKHGEIVGVLLNSRDVSLQQDILDDLQQSKESFQAAFNATSAISAISDPATGEFLRVNDAWVKALGWSQEEAIGKTALELNVWGSEENRKGILETLNKQGELKAFKAKLYSRTGTVLTVLVDAQRLDTTQGRIIFISGIDITEREENEAQLRQSQKLESFGQLTGGIAHDFNNLLTVIIGQAELAALDASDSEKVVHSMEVIQRSAESGAKLVHQLLAFARKQRLSPESFELGEHLKSIGPLLSTTLGKEIGLEITSYDKGCNGEGTTISLLIPRGKGKPSSQPQPVVRQVKNQEHRRVLLVEDNAEVRSLIS
jgi:PAS domain S-box-containing protein